MTRLSLSPFNPGVAIPANTYEFGVAALVGSVAAIASWQTGNTFDVADGRYYCAIRRIDNHLIVKDYTVLVSSVDVDQIQLVKGALSENDNAFLLPTPTANQTIFNVGSSQTRKFLYVNGQRRRLGIDYVIELPNLRWISPDFNLLPKHVLELSYF